jgi:uncharacterized protein (DUF952 family)
LHKSKLNEHKIDEIIFHILEENYFESQKLNGEYFSPTFDEEGFIHLSTKNQVENTLKRYYSGKSGLVLLHIETSKIVAELKYELASNGEFFPHIYGPINLDAIVEIEKIN